MLNSSGKPYPSAVNPNEGNGFFTSEGSGVKGEAEAFENAIDIHSVIVPTNAEITATVRPEKFNGIVELALPVQAVSVDSDGRISTADTTLRLIPYYAWNHRGRSNMSVWHKTAGRLYNE